MSITVEYLFNAELDLDSLVAQLNKKLGFSFLPYECNSNNLFCRFLGMELSLITNHGLVDDRECNFEDYAFQIGTRTPISDGDLRPMQVESMCSLAFAMHRRMDVQTGLLSFDAQTALARYRMTESGWYDDLSSSIVSFPQHFADVRSRIKRDDWVA